MSTDNFPNPGEVFQNRYRIVSVINRGGFGRVYRATQIELNRDVAIKVLQPIRRDGLDADQEAKRLQIVAKRFEREAQLVSQLRDSHTVMMHDYGTTPDGLLYMVLEFVDGLSLDAVVEEAGPLDPQRVVKIARQVLSSLDEAHALGMLHRDIKPQNIMLFDHAGRMDQVKVLDFGLAKSVEGGEFNSEDPDLTGEEVILGTPRYMSPEQIRGEVLGPMTDMYSLGLVMFEMLAGYKAVEGESTMTTLARHLNEVPIALPVDVAVPGALREFVDRMLLKKSAGRVQTAKHGMELLENWHLPSLAAAGTDDDELSAAAAHDASFAAFDDRKKKIAIYTAVALMILFLVVGVTRWLSPGDTVTAETRPDGANDTVALEAATLEDGVARRAADEPAAADEPIEVDTEEPAAQPGELVFGEPESSDEVADVVEPAPEPEPEPEKVEPEPVAQKPPRKRQRETRESTKDAEPVKERKKLQIRILH